MKTPTTLLNTPGTSSGYRLQSVSQPTKLGPLPFLLTVEPVNLAPVCPVLNRPATSANRKSATAWADKIEAFVLKLVAAVFVLTLLAVGFGVQQIAHARTQSQLGRALRQKEHELQAVTQAYRSLESKKAVEFAQASTPAEKRIAGGTTPQREPASCAGVANRSSGPKLAQATPIINPHRGPLKNETASRSRTRSTGVRG